MFIGKRRIRIVLVARRSATGELPNVNCKKLLVSAILSSLAPVYISRSKILAIRLVHVGRGSWYLRRNVWDEVSILW